SLKLLDYDTVLLSTLYGGHIMALSNLAIRNAKPAEKAYKLADSFGLYLLVSKSGSRLWRYDYTFGGKRKTLALGKYPDVSLVNARAARDGAKRLIADGEDPAVVKKLTALAAEATRENTFEALSDELLER